MSRHRTIKNQLRYCIAQSYKPGQSKHADKGRGKSGVRHDGRTYSYQSRSAKMDLAGVFAGWMRDQHPEINRAVDISDRHISEFLTFKAVQGCTQATLDAYSSNMRSISREIATTYGRSSIDIGAIDTPTSHTRPIRDIAIEPPDRARLERSFERGSNGAAALIISRAAGARSEEITRVYREDIAADGSCVHIAQGKGGRSRDIPVVTEQSRAELIELRERTPAEALVVPVKPESLNRTLRRHMAQVGLSDKYKDTTIHALRKTWAQERYDYYRDNGMSIRDAMGVVNRDLGHSTTRDDLIARYVANIH